MYILISFSLDFSFGWDLGLCTYCEWEIFAYVFSFSLHHIPPHIFLFL